MQIKFLKSIVEDLVGKQSVPIIDLLVDKKDVNEFQIAKKLNLTINQTRNILYKLSDYGLVSFIRKKDKKKGWYIYFWTLNIYQSLDLLENNLKKELEQTENESKSRKENRFYICQTCSIEVSEENALLNDFTCPECEEIYELADNQEFIQQLSKKINKLKKEIELVTTEKGKEGEKLDKKKQRKIKRVEKENSDKRKTARALKAKLNKKIVKKKPVKKLKKKTIKKTAKSSKPKKKK